MRSLLFGLLVGLLLLPTQLMAADWPALYATGQNSNASPNQPTLPLAVQGSFTSTYTDPVASGNIVIATESVGTTRYIIAYRLNDLVKLWQFSIGSSFPRQPIIYNNRVYFGLSTKGTIYSLDLVTGVQVWQVTLPGETRTSLTPVAFGESLFIVAAKLYRLNISNGSVIWSHVYTVQDVPAVDASGLYFRVFEQQLIKVSFESGLTLWSVTITTTEGTPAIVVDDTVFVATYRSVISVSATDGTVNWRYATGASRDHFGSLAVLQDRVIFSSRYGDISALNFKGEQLWTNRFNTSFDTGSGWLAPFVVAGDLIFAEASSASDIIIDARDGATVFRGLLNTAGSDPVAVAADRLFLNDDSIVSVLNSPQWLPGTLGLATAAAQLRPLIIIPGIFESWPINGQWQLDPFLHIFTGLINNLKEVGYVEDQNLFVFPYDWHQSNQITSQILKARIAEIKQQTQASAVDIVTHSMGGLVARSYIQGSDYAHDVDRLIMLGVPNHGSAKAYLAWEAGETGTSTVDTFKEQFIRYESIKAGYGLNPLRYIQERLVSAGELLPISSYLEREGNLAPYSPCFIISYPCNSFLEQLAQSENSLATKVRPLNIIGISGKSTIASYRLMSREDTLWQHGKPLNYPATDGLILGDGDGTVLASSAAIPGVEEIIINQDHTSMVNAAGSLITQRLRGKSVTVQQYDPVKSLLLIKIFSPVSVIVTDAQGHQLGADPITQEVVNSYPKSAYYSGVSEDEQYLIIPDPALGEYQLIATGFDGGEYTVEASLISGSEISERSVSGKTGLGQSSGYGLSILSNQLNLTVPSSAPSPSPSSSSNPSANSSPSPLFLAQTSSMSSPRLLSQSSLASSPSPTATQQLPLPTVEALASNSSSPEPVASSEPIQAEPIKGNTSPPAVAKITPVEPLVPLSSLSPQPTVAGSSTQLAHYSNRLTFWLLVGSSLLLILAAYIAKRTKK